MSTHDHGNMDVKEQEKTFGGFIKIGLWAIYISIAVLVFLLVFNA